MPVIPRKVPEGLDARTLVDMPERLAGCAQAVADARWALDAHGFSEACWQRLRAALWAYNTTLAAGKPVRVEPQIRVVR